MEKSGLSPGMNLLTAEKPKAPTKKETYNGEKYKECKGLLSTTKPGNLMELIILMTNGGLKGVENGE